MTDERDPVLIPSLPDPWEGLVRKVSDTAFLHGEAYARYADIPVAVEAIHAASRAERDLRAALLDLLRGGA